MIDHRGTVDPVTFGDGRLEECDTVACKHCQAVIKVLLRGACRKDYDTKFSCPKCGPICRACAEHLERTKSCPGPILAQIERALAGRRADERFTVSFARG